MRGLETHKSREATLGAARKLEPERRLRVLVIDDNIDHVRTIAFLVRNAGHEVDFAINGIVGLELAQRMRPDVVLLDIGLPDTSGFHLAGQIRKNPELKNAYVVGVTGLTVNREEALARGFDELLVKPLDFETIEGMLARKAK
jgi:CheY-like chemotaxis protein